MNGTVLNTVKITDAGNLTAGWYTLEYSIVGSDLVLSITPDGGAKRTLYTYAGAAASFEDGLASLGYGASSYGGNCVSNSVTVSSINGVAPNNLVCVDYPVPFDASVSQWNVIAPFLVDGSAGSVGVISYGTKGELKLNCGTGWWGQASVDLADKVVLAGTSMTFNMPYFGNASPNGYFGIVFSSARGNGHSANGTSVKGSSTWGIEFGEAAHEEITFYTSSTADLSLWADGVSGSIAIANVAATGTDVTITFGTPWESQKTKKGEPVFEEDGVTPVMETFVKVYINGEVITDINEDSGEEYDVAFNITDVMDEDGMAYVSLTAVGYGGSGGTVTVKEFRHSITGYVGAAEDPASAPVALGAQYRTTGSAGLRFGFNVYKKVGYSYEDIASMGTLILPANFVANVGGLTLENPDPEEMILNIPVDVANEKLYHNNGEYLTFTGVLIDIPDNQLDREFTAVGYVQYKDGTVVYSEAITRTVNGVIEASQDI